MTSVSADVLSGLLAELVGRECRRVSSGSGGVLCLELEGELGILIRCPWRLDAPDRVLAVSADPRGLERCLGARVRGFELAAPAYDLTVAFDGAILRAFADRPPDDGLNYCISSASAMLTVWHAGRLTSEPPG
jgi:hypothetical protein